MSLQFHTSDRGSIILAQQIFNDKNITDGQELNQIAKCTSHIFAQPVTTDRKAQAEQDLVNATKKCKIATSQGLIAEKRDIQNLDTALSAMEVAIKKRGLDTVTQTEIDIYQSMEKLHIEARTEPNSDQRNQYMRQFEKGLNTRSNPNEKTDSFATTMKRRLKENGPSTVKFDRDGGASIKL